MLRVGGAIAQSLRRGGFVAVAGLRCDFAMQAASLATLRDKQRVSRRGAPR